MEKITDEILMAYVDGELDDRQAEDVKKAVAANSGIRRRMAVFQESAAMLQGVYDAPLDEAVPKRLSDAVMGFKKDEKALGFLDRLPGFFRLSTGSSTFWKPTRVLAAVILLFIGGGTVHLAHTLLKPEQKHFVFALNGEAFNRGMETSVSGQSFRLEDQGIHILPVATFVDNSNQYCRQFEVARDRTGSRLISQGIACRDQSGRWATIVSIRTQPASLPDDPDSNYIPAGDGSLMDIVFSGVTASPPLSLKQEAELIQQSWSVDPKPE